MIGDEPLHTIGFSWLGPGSGDWYFGRSIFISRSQARWRKDSHIIDAFEAAFPQNSAPYFTYSALQGLAKALNSRKIIGVRAHDQIVFKTKNPQHFVGAYDNFWEKLGGKDGGGMGYEVPVPFHTTPLDEVASKHRKRAKLRRENWRAIEVSSTTVLTSHLRSAHHAALATELTGGSAQTRLAEN